MLAKQDNGPSEVRIDELRHRQEQRGRERHDPILPRRPRARFSLSEFFLLLPGTLAHSGLSTNRSDSVICETPLKTNESDLLNISGESAEIRVPIHPLNFCVLVFSRLMF